MAEYHHQCRADGGVKLNILVAGALMSDTIARAVERAVKDGGVRVDVHGGTFVEARDEWYFPRWPDMTVVVLGKHLAAAVAEFVTSNRDKFDENVYLGIWRHDQQYYIDLNAHTDNFADAKRLAAVYGEECGREIMSAYNPVRDETRYF